MKQYLDTELAEKFELRREKTAKPVLGSDDLLLLLTHLWARDTSVFPTEDQRLALAAIILLLMYTGCRPAEMVDAQKGKALKKAKGTDAIRKQEEDDDNWDSGYESMDETGDGDPLYENPDPWTNQNDTDYDDIDIEDVNNLKREYKALCYEDIRLWIVQNTTPGGRDLLAMEITLAHHKGADRKPKP